MQSIQSLRVCQVVSSVNEFTGGTAVYTQRLTEQLYHYGLSPCLLTLNYSHRGQQLLPAGAPVYSYSASFLTRLMRGFHPQASHFLHCLAAHDLDLIHSHGLWMFPNVYARRAALGNHLPLIISTHGMLEAWSLKNSQFKKKLALFLYERKNLQNATVLHAASLEEVKSIRRLGLKQPIALIPNAADLPDEGQLVGKEVLIQMFPELAEKRWLLFMSRLHPKKGLETLLKVWHQLAVKFPNWHLILAGPNSTDNYQADLKLLIKRLELTERVTFTGMLTGQPKASALNNSELFVLPTHSENFGIAVAESLSYGVPAITTKAAPWQDLEQYCCGWWIEDNYQALLEALVEGMELSAEVRLEMSKQARTLIQAKYSWQSTTQQMVEVYHWLVNKGQPPQCVQFCDNK